MSPRRRGILLEVWKGLAEAKTNMGLLREEGCRFAFFVGWCVGLLALGCLWQVFTGYLFASADDFARLSYALEWAESPFLAPEDHLWLTGNFALLGALIAAAGDPMEGILVFSFLSWGALGTALAVFGRWVAGLSWGALGFGAAGFLLHPVVLSVALSPMPDLLAWSLVLAGGSLVLAGWRTREEGPAAWLLVSGMGAGALATTLRFEAWIWGAALAVVVLVYLYRRWDLLDGRRRAVLLAAAAAPFVFPVIWMASSWMQLGDPLGFTRKENNPLLRFYTWGGGLELHGGARQEWGGVMRTGLHAFERFGLVVGWAGVLALLVAVRPLGARASALLVPGGWLLVIAFVSARGGISGNAPERVLMPAVGATIVLGAGLAWEAGARLLAARKEAWVRVPVVVAGAGLLVAMLAGFEQGFERTRHRGVSASTIDMGWRLRGELNAAPEYLEGVSHRERVFMWGALSRMDHGEFAVLRALSGEPGRLVGPWLTGPLPEHLANPEIRLLLLADFPRGPVEAAGFRRLWQTGEWALYARQSILKGDTDPTARVETVDGDRVLLQPGVGLMWMADAPGDPVVYTEAEAFADGLVHAGHDDWRLPTEWELWQVSAYSVENEPGYDGRLDPRARVYWTSGVPEGRPEYRRAIDFTRLFPHDWLVTSPAHVRPVRAMEPR